MSQGIFQAPVGGEIYVFMVQSYIMKIHIHVYDYSGWGFKRFCCGICIYTIMISYYVIVSYAKFNNIYNELTVYSIFMVSINIVTHSVLCGEAYFLLPKHVVTTWMLVLEI